MLYDGYNRRKQEQIQELENSGLVPQIADMVRVLNAENKKIAAIYNQQTLRITEEMEKRRGEWEEILCTNDVKVQEQFQQEIRSLRKNLAEYEREKSNALRAEIFEIADAKDRELNQALTQINTAVEERIRKFKIDMQNAVKESTFYAEEYHKSVKMLLKALKETYQGEKFCSHEMKEIQELISKSEEILETAPQASYAVIWDAVEKTLLAMNKAENLGQEWMMQYRIALVLAEEIKSVFTYENTLGYLVNGTYKQTREEAEQFCAENGIFPGEINEITVDQYIYGEFKELKENFDAIYKKLKEQNGEEVSLEELYTIIDDLNVKYGEETRKLIFEAKMNLNEALLIDRVEAQLNEALGGGYHSTGSARSGNCHNGEKHIVFERDGNPEEQICVVLKNGGWNDGDQGEMVLNTEVDLKVMKDNRISEKKRRQLRNRICDYLNADLAGANVTMSCMAGTENTLTTDHQAGNLREVQRRKVARKNLNR